MSTERSVPPLFARLVDDAAVFPPGNAPIPDALAGHAAHRTAWYADLVGPLLLPASALGTLDATAPAAARTEAGGAREAAGTGATGGAPAARAREAAGLPRIGVVGDTGLAGIRTALAAPPGGWVQYEIAVAKRGEDPQPGLHTLLAEAGRHPDLDVYAEVPLTWGLMAALDTLATARAGGARVAPKFRTGGLAAELFPTPVELAAVVCACRDRELPFKLTAGLHHAVRHTDSDTGFTHHGFLNVLAACLAAADGAEVADVAELLGATDPVPVVAAVRARRAASRPLWIGYGSCSMAEPLADLTALGLLDPPDRLDLPDRLDPPDRRDPPDRGGRP